VVSADLLTGIEAIVGELQPSSSLAPGSPTCPRRRPDTTSKSKDLDAGQTAFLATRRA
jgi:hypothetical protein